MSAEDEVRTFMRDFVDSDCSIITKNCKSIKDFEVILRVQLEDGETFKEKCDRWVKNFGAVSNTIWNVRSTCPNKRQYLYRKVYVCQHRYRSGQKVPPGFVSCPSCVCIKVKKTTKDIKKRDPFVKKNLDTVIRIVFRHTHELGVRKPRAVSANTGKFKAD